MSADDELDEPSKDAAAENGLTDTDRPYTPPGAAPTDKDTDDPNLVDSSEPLHEDSPDRNDISTNLSGSTSPEEEGHDLEENAA